MTMMMRGQQQQEQNFIRHGLNAADADGTTTSYGTYYTLRSARTRGAVYAPTPYGEVCVDDDGSTRVFQSETVRDGRALNPDWRWFDRRGGTRGNGVGEGDDDDDGALVRALSGRGASRMTWRDGPAVEVDRTFKLELCVYGTRQSADVVGFGFDDGRRAVGETRWKRGEGVGTTMTVGDGRNASDELICRAVVDLNRMVRLGDSIPSGVVLPSNCIFVWLEDGVYAPEPVSTDTQGQEIQGFIDEVLERNAREKLELNSVSNVVIDRVVMDDEEGSMKLASRRESASVSPISSASMTASQQWSMAEKHVELKRLELKPAVSRVEALIEANARHRDVRELRDELALRLEMQLNSLKGVETIWGNRTAEQKRAIDAREGLVKVDGLTLDEQMTMLTSELTEERESYSLMKADIARRVRGLRQAGEKLDEAISQLEEAERQLDGPDGMGRLYQKQRALVARRWRLVDDLAKIFPITSVDGVGNGSQSKQKLQIGDLALDLGPGPTELKSMRTEDLENDAAAYGHVAQICVQLAAILDVRLRYPICPSLSRSYICDFQQVPVKPGRASERSDRRATRLARIEFPLFMDNLGEGDRTRYTYGVFLLNKNLAQLLNAHGENSVGPRHTLQNLKRIFDLRKNAVVARGSIEEAP